MGAFEEFVYRRFGIPLDGYIVEERTSKVYIYSQSLAKVDARCIQRKGVLAGRLDTLYGIKPSLDFVLLFGHLAARNFIVLSDDEVVRAYANQGIPCSADLHGLVIAKDSKGRGACIGICKNGTFTPLTPKERIARTSSH